jgi:hypothetical protein
VFRTLRRLGWRLALCLLAAKPSNALAASPTAPTVASTNGRPQVTLDRLDFPAGIPGAAGHKHRLESFLRREVRRVDWGAGAGNHIEYRFAVTELTIERHGDVLRVRCTALGRLPGNRTAKSRLDFGGDPKHPTALVDEVLRIVARGVVTRLAELERQRRGLR